jgi:hypothetical protein
VDFDEFKAWWTKEMAKDGVVAPSTFTFRNMCVRAVLRHEAGGGTGAHHWIAEDIQNVLFRTEADSGPKKPKASPETMVPVAVDHTIISLEAARLYADNPYSLTKKSGLQERLVTLRPMAARSRRRPGC